MLTECNYSQYYKIITPKVAKRLIIIIVMLVAKLLFQESILHANIIIVPKLVKWHRWEPSFSNLKCHC